MCQPGEYHDMQADMSIDDHLLLYGKPLAECSREELEQFVRYAARELFRLNTPEEIHARAAAAVERLKTQ